MALGGMGRHGVGGLGPGRARARRRRRAARKQLVVGCRLQRPIGLGPDLLSYMYYYA